MPQKFTDLKIGDWIRTQRGQLFEIVEVRSVPSEHLGVEDYGPEYFSEHGASALACAVVEVRKKK